MLKIGNIELKNCLIAGPMAGISNPAFRQICIENGAGLVVSEMVSDKAICHHNKKTLNMLKTYSNEHPIAIQLFGGEVESMVEAAKYIDDHCDCEIIDINMGCPVNKVIKAKAGSDLLRNPDTAYRIVSEICKVVHKPVTIKLRLGFDENSINILDMAKLMEEAGASAIAIHCRTRSQFYSGKPDYSWLKKVKDVVKIPVIANGDIRTIEDVKNIIESTGVDGVMIARGSIGNPWIFSNSSAFLEGKGTKTVSFKDSIKACLYHAEKLYEYEQNELITIKQMRGLMGYYLKGFDGASKLRQRINEIETLEDFKNALKAFL